MVFSDRESPNLVAGHISMSTCSGVIHLVINFCSIVFIGIHLAQEFGTLRTGLIYVLSALYGTLVAALFVDNVPAVGSSAALYGLHGATLSALIQNWEVYTNKFTALASVLISIGNDLFGLILYVDNYSNFGGFVSGFLLGEVVKGIGSLLDWGLKSSMKARLRQELDRPIYRSICLLLLVLMLSGCLVAVLYDINMDQYSKWCQYVFSIRHVTREYEPSINIVLPPQDKWDYASRLSGRLVCGDKPSLLIIAQTLVLPQL